MFRMAKRKGHLINSFLWDAHTGTIGYNHSSILTLMKTIRPVHCSVDDEEDGEVEAEKLGVADPQCWRRQKHPEELQRVLLKHQCWWSEGQMVGVDAGKKF